MRRGGLLGLAFLILSSPAFAATHYVRAGWTNPVPPYTNWVTAASNIQAAVNAAANGETVLVTNGTYRVFSEIVITNGVTVRSVNGPADTTVSGGNPLTTNRCFTITHANALLDGFTITNGNAAMVGFGGGGVLLSTGTVANCVVRNCRAYAGGGVVIRDEGTVSNCVLKNNLADMMGGGAYLGAGTLQNCIIVSNITDSGGGVWFQYGGTARDCLVIGNEAVSGGGVYLNLGGAVLNCTLVRNNGSTHGGGLFFSAADTNTPLVRNTICILNTAGDSTSNYCPIDTLNTNYCNYCCIAPRPNDGIIITEDPRFASPAAGDFHLIRDSPCLNAGTNEPGLSAETDLDGNPRITGPRVDIGAYEIPYVYVSLVGSNTPPYETWAKAATNIQTAVNAFSNYCRVFVTNGTYASTGEISVAKAIDLSSVNGVDVTTISGGGAHRCMSVTSNAIIQGFTFTNGYLASGNGAGLYCDSGATVRLCRITGNYANEYGGGIFFGGGGSVEDSIICGNTAVSNQGGGVYCRAGDTVRNCLIVTNVAHEGGGVMAYQGGLMENCTIVGNVSGAQPGGGVRFYEGVGEVRNSIVYFNIAPSPANIAYHNSDGTVSYTCTTPAHTGVNNITNDPAFPSPGDYHVPYGSPCVDVGTNQPWMTGATDLEGYPRIIDSVTDLGAYECTPAHHVSKTGTNDWPFLNSSGGATNVQAGIDAAGAGDIVYVGAGTYAEGATITIPAGRDIELRGLAGADATILDGQSARRVLETVADAPIIHGFTFKNGRGSGHGGALWMTGGGTVYDCTIVSNCASSHGGGICAYGSVVVSNCLLAWNGSGSLGGGLCAEGSATVVDCAFVGNVATSWGGGACVRTGFADRCVFRENRSLSLGGGWFALAPCVLRDSLFVGNSAAGDGGGIHSWGEIESCTIVGNSAPGGAGGGLYEYWLCTVRNSIVVSNTASSDPNVQLLLGSVHDHNCIVPALGSNCLTNDPRFADAPAGDYRLAANSPCVNAGTNLDWMTAAADVEGYPRIVDTNADMGAYERTPVHYVDNKLHGTWPYIEPGSGFRDVQAVVDAAHRDDEIRVGPGTYTQSAAIAVSKRLTIRGTNGWSSTIIAGGASDRCFLVTTSAVLDNLTLRGGHGSYGGGVYITGGGAMQDCLVVSNRASNYGGGVFLQSSGVLTRCMIYANTAPTNDGGGVYLAQGGFVDSCRVLSNTARKAGGIFFDTGGRAINTLVCENDAVSGSGGAMLFYTAGRADHCTVVSNTASSSGGGVFCDHGGEIVNSIVYFNTAPSGPDYKLSPTGMWDHCCTTPAIGSSCVTNDPLVIAGYRLPTNSPCLDVALEILSRDIEGMWRPLDSDDSGLAVSDLGAYELLNPLADSDWDHMPDGWENQYYGSPFGCATPLADDDGDSVTNRDEAIADTDPHDAGAYFRILSITNEMNGNHEIRVPSSTSRVYSVERTTDVLDPSAWMPVVGPLPGNGGILPISATNAAHALCERAWVEVP